MIHSERAGSGEREQRRKQEILVCRGAGRINIVSTEERREDT